MARDNFPGAQNQQACLMVRIESAASSEWFGDPRAFYGVSLDDRNTGAWQKLLEPCWFDNVKLETTYVRFCTGLGDIVVGLEVQALRRFFRR